METHKFQVKKFTRTESVPIIYVRIIKFRKTDSEMLKLALITRKIQSRRLCLITNKFHVNKNKQIKQSSIIYFNIIFFINE